MKAISSSRQGSILLVTLLMTALILAVVMTFVAVVQQELRQVDTRMRQDLARQHARLALDLALSKLQQTAGNDQRVTARADILGPTVAEEANLWHGVWQQDGSGNLLPNPLWLVSGINPSPVSGAGTGPDSVEIFPAITSSSPVRVPIEPIRNATNTDIGQLAYWVSDESSKASLAARRQGVSRYGNSPLDSARSTVEFQTDFGIRLDPFFDSPTVDLADDYLVKDMDKIATVQDALLVEDSAGVLLTPLLPELPMHDLTPLALGVIENAADGGLKANLSDLSYRDSFLATDATAAFLGPKGPALTVEAGPVSASEGEPWFSPRPVITEAVLYIGLFHTWSDAKVRIRYHLQAELMNPYTWPLIFPRDGSTSQNRGLVLIVQGLPDITVRDLSGTAPTLTDSLDDFMYAASGSTRETINSWINITPTTSPNRPQLLPGEVYQVMEPNPATQARGLARDFTTTRWSGSAGTRPDDHALVQIDAVHPPGGVSLYAVPYASSGPPLQNRPVITALRHTTFDDFTLTKRFNSGPNPFSRATSSSYIIDDYNFAYHFRFWSDETDPSSLRDLMTGANLLDPLFDAAGEFTDLQGMTRSNSEVLAPINTYPPDIVQDTLNLFSGLDQFTDGTPRSHDPDYRAHLLIDVPNDDTFSVGRLSHLPIVGKPPQLIGSPWGEDINAAFDRYYFSPKHIDPDTGNPSPAHPAVQALSSPAVHPTADDSTNELLHGAFNLNSTSVDAWEAVLSAPILTPTADDESGSGQKKRSGAFFRLPGYQAEETPFVVTDAEIETADSAFAQGVRTLEGPQGRHQLRQIAQSIVDRLISRGEPFPTLRSFVNSGILQEAIDQVSTTGTPSAPEINDGITDYSNLYLTQNDLLTKLAPTLVPRGDTFRVRTYGNTITPTGEIISEARLEAVIQRLPSKRNGSDPMTPSTTLTDTRNFRILSLKWLSDESS